MSEKRSADALLQHDKAIEANTSAYARAKEADQAEKKSQAHTDSVVARVSPGSNASPMVATLSALPCQWCLALVAGACGFLSVLGPSSFTRIFMAVAGSAVGGLLASGCMCYVAACVGVDSGDPSARASGFSDDGSAGMWPSVFGAMQALVMGYGFDFGYGLWFVLMAMGIFRYALGFECDLRDMLFEPDVVNADSIVVPSQMTSPLLAKD